MPELNFKITGDDSHFNKTIENMKKTAAAAASDINKSINAILDEEEKKRKAIVKITEEQKKASDGVVKATESEAKAQDKVTEAIKRKNAAFDASGKQIRPVQMSNSQDEINAANLGRAGTIPSGTVVGSSLDFNKLANDANAYGESVRKANTAATASQQAFTSRIKESQVEIARISNAGKKGYDELGNKITVTIGKQEQLTDKLRMFEDALNRAKAPQSFVNLNRKIEATTAELNRLRNAGKTGFDELGNKIEQANGKTNSFINRLKNLAGVLGVTFGIYQILQWGKELFNIANTASGIERAFSKLGDGKYLEKLRSETKGFVSDIQLEKLTVQANNLNVPLKGMGTYLAFATQRAKDTGESVEKLTSDIINGLGRESPRIIDNLGISQKELNKEIAKTGNFAEAVSNIMVRSMSEAGVAVDTLADKTNRISVMWDNATKSLAGFLAKLLNPDVADNDKIAILTQNSLSKIGDFAKRSAEERSRILIEQQNKVAAESSFYQATPRVVNSASDMFSKGSYYDKANDEARKRSAERLAAEQNTLSVLKQQNAALMVKERQSAGVYNQNELEEKISNLTIKFKDSIDPKERANLKKQIDQSTALLEGMNGKADKKGAKQDTVDAGALRAQENLQQRIQELKDKFQRKGLTKEHEANKAIIDEFTKLAFDIEQQGKKYDAYAKKYGSARALGVLGPKQTAADLEPVKEKALNDSLYRQDTAKFELAMDKQREAYQAFEDWKRMFGIDSANKRFKGELDTSTTYLEKLKDRYSKLIFKSVVGVITGKPTLTGPEQEELDLGSKRIEAANKQIKDKRDTDYADAYQAALTFNQRIEKINAEYRKKAADLGPEITDANKIELNQQRDNAINAAKDEALAKTAIYKKVAEETVQITRSQVNDQIKALEGIMSNGGLPDDVKAKVQGQLSVLKVTLKVGVDQANLNNLKTEYQDVLTELNATDEKGDSIVSEDAKKRILKRLVEIKTKIDSIDKDGNSIASWGDKVAKNFDYLSGSSLEFADSMSKDLSRLSSGFSELSSAVAGNDTQAGYLLDTISQLTKAGSEATGAFVSFASGDIIGGITKTMSAVASVLSIGKKVKEMNAAARKEVSDFYAAAIKGETEYQALLRQRELDTAARGKNSYRAIIDQLDAIKKQSPEIQKAYDAIFSSLQGQEYKEGMGSEHGTWFRKAKTWDVMASLFGSDYDNLEKLDSQGKLIGATKTDFDNLKTLREELDAAGVSAEDLKQQLGELLTGTSTSGLADGLKSLFENGKRSAQDFGDSFEEIMRNALLNTFKAKFLDDALQPFYEELAAMMEAGTPTESQIEALKEKYIKLGQDADTYLDTVEKVTGVDLSDSTSTDSALKKGITAITSDQASALEGITRGQYEQQKITNANQLAGNNIAQQNLEVSMQHLRWAEQTAQNTGTTVIRLDTAITELKTISKNTTSGSFRGAGLG